MSRKDKRVDVHLDDADNPEWTAEDFARAKPVSELLGPELAALLVRKGGRPAKPPAARKRQVTMRFAPDLLDAMRATGRGWSTRAERALRKEFLKESQKKSA